jgi:Ca2+-binding EF-hand superfamily protein
LCDAAAGLAAALPQADVDKSGQLSRKEFKDALKAAELGLTRKDINLILSQARLSTFPPN